MSTIGQRATEWLTGSDTGISSVAICRHMLGIAEPRKHSHPRDGDDLGRCLRLLERIPEWKLRINEMAAYGPYWEALAARWDELEASLAEEAGPQFERLARSPKTYKLMRQILDPITDKDASVIRLGEGVTMSFGD